MSTTELNMRAIVTGRRDGQDHALKFIVLAWLAAGILDILAAFATAALKGVMPALVLKSIASGLIGAKAYRGGLDMAALGLMLHFAIMFGIVLVYWFASRKWGFQRESAFAPGLIYGVAVYAAMNLLVLPLSAIAFKPDYSATSLVLGIGVHMLFVGLPIALIVRRLGKVAPH